MIKFAKVLINFRPKTEMLLRATLVATCSTAAALSMPSFWAKYTTTPTIEISRPEDALLGAKSTAAEVLTKYRAKGLPAYVQRGGTAVVTGGNQGIGLESVRVLLEAGCRVVLCSRDADAGAKALASLGDGVDATRVRVQKLDLADLSSVKAASEEIAVKEGSVSLLLLNAGVMACPRLATKDGFEMQIGVNHLGHHALARLLLPRIEPDGRVVTLASTAHKMGFVDAGDLFFERRTYAPWAAYGQSKAANVLFAKALADELERAGSRILSVSLHPGVIQTALWRHNSRAMRWLLHTIIARPDKDVPQGASTSIYASLAGGLAPGAYLADCAEGAPSEHCADADGATRRALWEASEKLVAGAGLELPAALLGAPACEERL